VTAEYGVQRLIYALAALRSGARTVEVAHVFLERPEAPVSAVYTAEDEAALERELSALAAGALAGSFPVAPEPCRALCAGCPGEGGLCSWPLELTRRDLAVKGPAPEIQTRLF
jgi:hypothetical protein